MVHFIKKWGGYTLYSIILLGVLLYYRFPSDALLDYLEAGAAKFDPRIVLSIDRVNLSLPPGLTFSRAELSLKDTSEKPLFRAERFSARPDVWSFFRRKFKCNFEVLAYRGDLKGHVYFKNNGITGPFDSVTELKDIHIGEYKSLQDLIGRRVEGTLSGIISYNGLPHSLVDGTADGNFRLTDVRMENFNLHPLVKLDSIDFKEMEIVMALRGQKIDLSRLKLEGRQFHGNLSGTIRLKKKFSESALELKGEVKPSAEFFQNTEGMTATVKFVKQHMKKGALSFSIYGTLGDPKIKFI